MYKTSGFELRAPGSGLRSLVSGLWSFAPVVCVCLCVSTSAASAQTPPAHDMSHMQHDHGGAGSDDMRDGSGTSWLPDNSPMYAIHAQKGSWQLMFHENAFLQFIHESGDR